MVVSETDKAVAELTTARLAGEDIATGIERVAAAGEALLASGLKKTTLIMLLQDITKMPKRDIKRILDAFAILPNYLEKPRES